VCQLLEEIPVQVLLEKKSKKGEKMLEISSQATVFTAIKQMCDRNAGSILVRSDLAKKKIISGIFTEHDYLRRVVLKNLPPESTFINNVMTTQVVAASLNTNIWEISRLMTAGKFRHVPIVRVDQGFEEPVGVVSSFDIIPYMYAVMSAVHENSEEVNEMKCYSICRKSSTLCYVNVTDTVGKALQIMETYNIGAVFVTNKQKLVGTFTEHDYVHKVAIQGRHPKDTPVREVMEKNCMSVHPTTSVVNALEIMQTQKMRNISIVPLIGKTIDNDSGRNWSFVGMLTEMDIIKYLHSISSSNALTFFDYVKKGKRVCTMNEQATNTIT